MGNMGVFDPTEIHNRGQLKSHMKEAMIKLGYHLLCFFIYLYRWGDSHIHTLTCSGLCVCSILTRLCCFSSMILALINDWSRQQTLWPSLPNTFHILLIYCMIQSERGSYCSLCCHNATVLTWILYVYLTLQYLHDNSCCVLLWRAFKSSGLFQPLSATYKIVCIFWFLCAVAHYIA